MCNFIKADGKKCGNAKTSEYCYIQSHRAEIINDKKIKSIAAIIEIVGSYRGGKSYRRIYNIVNKYGLDTYHWTGQLWSKGRKLGSKVDINEYLTNKRKTVIAFNSSIDEFNGKID